MKKRTLAHRIICLMFALCIFTYVFTGTDIREADNSLKSSASRHYTASFDALSLVRGIFSEDLLSQGNAKITRPDASRRQGQQKSFENFYAGSYYLLFTAGIMYLIMPPAFWQVRYCKKYIIKYIHDQDGPKGTPSFYLNYR